MANDVYIPPEFWSDSDQTAANANGIGAQEAFSNLGKGALSRYGDFVNNTPIGKAYAYFSGSSLTGSAKALKDKYDNIVVKPDGTIVDKDGEPLDLPPDGGPPPDGWPRGDGGQPKPISYIDAPYAERYGMSAETAYQEALANTAYQRQVADLKAAGLNPVLGFRGSGADGVSAAALASSQSVSRASGGSGGSSGSDSSWMLRALIPIAVGAAVGFGTKNAYAGATAAKTLNDVLKGAFS